MERVLVRIEKPTTLSTGEVLGVGALLICNRDEASVLIRGGDATPLMEGREVSRQSRIFTQPRVAAYVKIPKGRHGPH